MEYVAIDFETANQSPDSACAVGLSRFDEEGREVASWYSLIRPPVMYFDPGNTAIHGLGAADCRWQPLFCELADQIIDFVGDRPLVAHNAPFDMRVLRASAACYGIQLPNWDYYCSLAIARKVLPHFRSRSLGVLVSDYLCSDYDAHVASDDARACGLVFGRMLHDRLYDKATLDHYLSLMGVNYPKKLNQAGQA